MQRGANEWLHMSETVKIQLGMRDYAVHSPIMFSPENPKERSNFKDLCVNVNHIKIALKEQE
jgi:hypothetical protein